MASATFPPAVGGDGSTVTDDANPETGLKRAGYQVRLVPAFSNVVSVAEFAKVKAEESLANKTAAATSAAEAKTSELAAATFANAAQQTTLGFDTNRPKIRPSLNLDFVNQQVVDRRIVVNRNSPKTYFGKEKVLGDENLLRYSEDFSNSYWNRQNATFTSNNEVAPDGTLTADTLVNLATNASNPSAFFAANQSLVSGQKYWISLYVKQGTLDYFRFGMSNGNVNFLFDFTIGEFRPEGAAVNSSVLDEQTYVEPAANGFLRIAIKFTATSTAVGARIYWSDATNNVLYASAGGETLIVWGAQLETAREGQTKPTAYVRTDAYPVRTFFNKLQTAAANTMPVEFDPITQECLGIKPESQAVNQWVYSEDYTNATWTKTNITVVPNVTLAPNGLLAADAVIANTGLLSHNIRPLTTQGLAITNSFVVSVYLKKKGLNRYAYIYASTANAPSQVFESRIDFDAGTATFNQITGPAVTNPVATIKDVGNGWFHCVLSVSGLTSILANVWFITSPNSVTNALGQQSQGDGFSGFYIWGAQLEASTLGVPSSYIPTTTAAVTRLADDLSMPVSAFEYNQNEGTLYVEVDFNANSFNDPRPVRINTPTGRIEIFRSGASIGVYILNQGLAQTLLTKPFSQSKVKFSVSYKQNSLVAYLNGELAFSDTTVIVLSDATKIYFGSAVGGNYLNDRLVSIRYYPKALSALEAQSLTQI